MHSACASNTAWILGVPADGNNKDGPLESEIRRRRFWASYLLGTFQSDNLFPKVPTEAMLNTRLPCSEHEFLILEKPTPGPTLWSTESTQSIYAELVRAMALWSSVVALIRQSEASQATQGQSTRDSNQGRNLSTRLVNMQALDGRIHEAWSRLDPIFYLDSTWPLYPPSICRGCSFYRSSTTSASARCQLSSQTAYEHANVVSELLQGALQLSQELAERAGGSNKNSNNINTGPASWDAGRMPSFTGYAAYCACAIQTPFLWCTRPEVKQQAVCHILTDLKTLQVLGKHWVFLKALGRFACGLYKVHVSAPFPLTDEPKNMTPEALKGFQSANSRARLSILTHNSIIVSDQGSTAQVADDIGGLGLVGDENDNGSESQRQQNDMSALPRRDPALSSTSPNILPAVEESIAVFISQISREVVRVTDSNSNSTPTPATATSTCIQPMQIPITVASDAPMVHPMENLNFYEMVGTFDWSACGPRMDQFGQIEDWISELLQQGA